MTVTTQDGVPLVVLVAIFVTCQDDSEGGTVVFQGGSQTSVGVVQEVWGVLEAALVAAQQGTLVGGREQDVGTF